MSTTGLTSDDRPASPQRAPDGRPIGPDGKPLPGPQQMQQVMAQRRMDQQQAQVNEVVDIMKDNIERVLDRDSKLNELDERADALQDGASQFEKQAGKLKNKFWMQNMKMIIACCMISLIVLAMLYFKFSDDDPPHGMMPRMPPAIIPAQSPPPQAGLEVPPEANQTVTQTNVNTT